MDFLSQLITNGACTPFISHRTIYFANNQTSLFGRRRGTNIVCVPGDHAELFHCSLECKNVTAPLDAVGKKSHVVLSLAALLIKFVSARRRGRVWRGADNGMAGTLDLFPRERVGRRLIAKLSRASFYYTHFAGAQRSLHLSARRAQLELEVFHVRREKPFAPEFTANLLKIYNNPPL
jgi:hypothetical protein